MTCPAASFCRKSSHGHKVRGHRRGLRPQKPGCAFSDPQDTTHSQAGCDPAGTPRALVQSASAEPRQTQCTTCMQPYEPSAPPVGTCRAVACACTLSSHRRQRPRQKELSRDSFCHELGTGEKGPWCLYQEITRDPPKITTGPRWVPWCFFATFRLSQFSSSAKAANYYSFLS